ncbi:hypothetical protein R6Q57_028253 [Mikania cordata]
MEATCGYLRFIGFIVEKINAETRFVTLPMVQFLDDMESEKPIRFTSKQLRLATNNFKTKLGSGGFGTVYKGVIGNNQVAVKVLNGISKERVEEQFMAEVSTMGRTHHFNLVRLFGFCFGSSLIALVYEYMVNGSLDSHLFKRTSEAMIGFDKLHEIAVGTAKGITYLHEDCAQRIVHYDIKPGNILLDSNFCPKVADFGLAKLCNRENTHISLAVGRGTPGYAAPEIWMCLHVTHKCDVYSFGMLLFEITDRRRRDRAVIHDIREWFPVCVWEKYEKNQLEDLIKDCKIEEKDHEVVKRMLKVALCCVQYKPETRPCMSFVVKMLEGVLEVPEPLNPFTHFLSVVGEPSECLHRMTFNISGCDWSSSNVVTISDAAMGAPPMKTDHIEITVA